MSKSGFSCICNPLPLSSFWCFFLCFYVFPFFQCECVWSLCRDLKPSGLAGLFAYLVLTVIHIHDQGLNWHEYSFCLRAVDGWSGVIPISRKEINSTFCVVDKNTWWLPWACWYAWWASRVCGLLHLFKSCGGHWQTVSLIQEKLKAETKQPHVMTQTFKETYPSHERVWKLLGRVKAKSTSIYPVLGCRYAGACPSCYGVRGRVHPEQVATLSQGWCIQTDNQSRWHSHINTSQPHSLISRLFTYCLRGYTSTALVDYCIDDKKINFSWFI